ncbi:TOBE domain-containing protein [Ideonella sp.]|uniref:TOBE domain-containing protein n=1 Tax=Ideonella sp. TaxID=1929293 RepID=UPI003BB634B8
MSEKKMPSDDRLGVGGAVWLTVGGESFGGKARIELLRAIVTHGSITHAAKAVGMSYKAAWEAIDAMNTLAGEPLVARMAGGKGGGSTQLTARGLRLVERFGQIDAVHLRFLKLLDDGSIDLAREFSLLDTVNLKTSASNQFIGTVSSVRTGAVNDEVELRLEGGARIVAMLSHDSTQALGLRTGLTAFALLPSAGVMLATGVEGVRLSARNQMQGAVAGITPGAVNAEVQVALDGGGQLQASVTQASIAELGLRPGGRVTALFNASSVILAVTA